MNDSRERESAGAPDPAEITRVLGRVRRLDDEAADEVLPMLYAELRELAASCMRREAVAHTLQPTAVVHEAWMKICGGAESGFASRSHFFGIAARAMRQILVDHARRRDAAKRGGGAIERVTLAELSDTSEAERTIDIVALHDALAELEQLEPRMASIVELRFFGGLTIREAAEVTGVSETTVDDDWAFARAWLRRKLEDPNP